MGRIFTRNTLILALGWVNFGLSLFIGVGILYSCLPLFELPASKDIDNVLWTINKFKWLKAPVPILIGTIGIRYAAISKRDNDDKRAVDLNQSTRADLEKFIERFEGVYFEFFDAEKLTQYNLHKSFNSVLSGHIKSALPSMAKFFFDRSNGDGTHHYELKSSLDAQEYFESVKPLVIQCENLVRRRSVWSVQYMVDVRSSIINGSIGSNLPGFGLFSYITTCFGLNGYADMIEDLSALYLLEIQRKIDFVHCYELSFFGEKSHKQVQSVKK